MIDYRVLTFIDVCETRSLTKTAKNMCLTQPAVTQHIKFLEQTYQTKLLVYEEKQMKLTEAGALFLEATLKTKALLTEVTKEINQLNTKHLQLNFGVTLTIADYVMPDITSAYMKQNEATRVNITVDNTSQLTDKLSRGELDFAVVEGYFDKELFNYQLLKQDEFILVTSYESELPKQITIEELKNQQLIIREVGSGSRDILEKLLANVNASINQFKQYHEVGSIQLIKQLVELNQGITFIYKEAVKHELAQKRLKQLTVESLQMKREFNFIYLKSRVKKEKILQFYEFAKQFVQ